MKTNILGILVIIALIASVVVLGTYSTSIDTLKVDTINYKGHTMLIYHRGAYFSVCHSPECKKCTTIYN